jgi:D-alanyl-D-alanine carboxypeptidase
VYDLSTNTVLYGQRENAVLPLASLTKLFTVYTALANTPSQTTVTISERALAPEGDSGLTLGEHISLGALERLALVASSNDAAEAISEATEAASNRPSTALMANAVSALGISDVRTSNASGLDISTTQSGGYGSALSVAKVAKSITEMDPSLAYTTTKSSITVKSDTKVHTLENTNQTIDVIPSPLLSKTGFTDLAGGNLVVVFDAGIQHPVAVVVLGSTKEFDEMMAKYGDFESVIRGIQIVGVPYAGPILDKQNDDDNLFALMNTASYLAGSGSDTRWWEESFSELPPTERKTFHACIYVLFSLAFNSEEVKK